MYDEKYFQKFSKYIIIIFSYFFNKFSNMIFLKIFYFKNLKLSFLKDFEYNIF
jgi:hypothetical protein